MHFLTLILEQEESGEVDQAKISAANDRHHRANQFFGSSRNRLMGPPSTPAQVGATTSLAELEASKSSALKGVWTVLYVVRRSSSKGSVDKSIGSATLPFPSDTTIPGKLSVGLTLS
jgi:hypothetical protein